MGTRSYQIAARGKDSLDATTFLLALHDIAIHAYTHLFSQTPSLYPITRPRCLSLSMGPMVVVPRERLEFYECFCFSDHVSKVQVDVPGEFATMGLRSLEINVHHSDYVAKMPEYRYLSIRLVLEDGVHLGVSLRQPRDSQIAIVDFYNTTNGWRRVEPWIQRLFLTNSSPCILLLSAILFPTPAALSPACMGAHVQIQSTMSTP